MKRLLRLDWDAIAGIVAAVAALVLHLLHVIEPDVMQMILLVLIALLFIRDLRAEHREAEMTERLARGEVLLDALVRASVPPDASVIGPRTLRDASSDFARRAEGRMVWFNVCLSMFRPQPLFDTLLRPAIDNPAVSAIDFVVDESQRDVWEREVRPKLMACAGAAKVAAPTWCRLPETLSFIMAETAPRGRVECLLSFWGEPFMSRSVAGGVPRFIFRLEGDSELMGRLSELERGYRLSA